MDDSKKILVTNIQRFSLHDGPGIRTTVFLKGCLLHCPWCANPENLVMRAQPYEKDGKQGNYGIYVTPSELFEEIMKDRMFYGAEGGVTFSGGEPLLQIFALEPLLQKLQQEHIPICMETSLFAAPDQLAVALRYTDLFYADCKVMDPVDCATILGGQLQMYLTNLHTLSLSGKPVIYRIPVIDGYTDKKKNLDRMLQLFQLYPPQAVELLPGHRMGESKYRALGLEPPCFADTDKEFLESYCQQIQALGIPCRICRI